MKNHAVRKFEVAKAMGSFSGQKRKTKSGVKGKGRYKTWTVQGMLRAALLVGQGFLCGSNFSLRAAFLTSDLRNLVLFEKKVSRSLFKIVRKVPLYPSRNLNPSGKFALCDNFRFDI